MIAAALAIFLAFQTPSPEAVRHLRAGIDADKNGQLDSALAEFQKASELDPTMAAAFLDLGQVYVEKHAYASAVPPLKRALALNPNIEGGHQLLGYALLAQGYAVDAIPHLEKGHVDEALGIALLEAGRLPEAVAVLQKALARHPDDPDLLYYYGRASGLLSKQVFDDLEARVPDSARAHQMMAQNYVALRDLPNAEKEYLEALRLRPETANLHLELGELYARAQQWDKAEKQFRLETESQPGSPEASYRLGEALLQEGQFHAARLELVRSDQLRKDMPETLYLLGKAASLDGDDALAEKSWLHVLKLENNTSLAAQAHFGLAGIYRKQGKSAEASREMEAFRKLQSPAAQAQDAPQ